MAGYAGTVAVGVGYFSNMKSDYNEPYGGSCRCGK